MVMLSGHASYTSGNSRWHSPYANLQNSGMAATPCHDHPFLVATCVSCSSDSISQVGSKDTNPMWVVSQSFHQRNSQLAIREWLLHQERIPWGHLRGVRRSMRLAKITKTKAMKSTRRNLRTLKLVNMHLMRIKGVLVQDVRKKHTVLTKKCWHQDAGRSSRGQL